MDIDLRACAEGDKQAWDAFVVRYSGLIIAAVRRTLRGGGSAEIDDIVQDVFLRLLRDDRRVLRSFDPARASLSTWLTLVARSVAIDRLRRRTIKAAGLDGVDVPAPPAAAEQGAQSAQTGTLPMHLLTPRQRLVLRMLFDQDMQVEEAAALLGVSEQTIRSTKHKALSRLREHLESGPAAGVGDGEGSAAVEQHRSPR
jgi:RNA polymerase sigma-70 factor (ECF subfamily)